MEFLLKLRYFREDYSLKELFNASGYKKEEIIDMRKCELGAADCTVTVPKHLWEKKNDRDRAEWCQNVLKTWFSSRRKPYSENQKLVVLAIVGLLPQKLAEFSIKDGFNRNAENLMGVYYQYYQA